MEARARKHAGLAVTSRIGLTLFIACLPSSYFLTEALDLLLEAISLLVRVKTLGMDSLPDLPHLVPKACVLALEHAHLVAQHFGPESRRAPPTFRAREFRLLGAVVPRVARRDNLRHGSSFVDLNGEGPSSNEVDR